jgi:hypothetical protein
VREGKVEGGGGKEVGILVEAGGLGCSKVGVNKRAARLAVTDAVGIVLLQEEILSKMTRIPSIIECFINGLRKFA